MADTRVYAFYGHRSGAPGNFMSNFYPSVYTFELQELISFMGDRLQEDTKQILISEHPKDITVHWSEQGFMLVKCLCFLDKDEYNLCLFGDMLNARSPADVKALGRQVRGYDNEVWAQFRQQAMHWNLLKKFGQNPRLKGLLLETGSRHLVEASPNDKIWGVGLRKDDSRVHDPSQWPKGAQNLLGETLMAVRDELGALSSEL